jgi:hypothetical protein
MNGGSDFGSWEDGWEEPGKIAKPKTESRRLCRRARRERQRRRQFPQGALEADSGLEARASSTLS